MDIVDEDVDTWEALLWPIMFFISAIEFCISPRPCLTAAADELDDEDLEDDDVEEDEREEDISRWVDDVLAIRDVVVLDEEDTFELLLLELLLFRSFFVIFLSRFIFSVIYRWTTAYAYSRQVL